MDYIKEGDIVLIIYDKRRQWIREVKAGKQFHTDRGMINFNQLIGKPFGISVRGTPGNQLFHVFKPLPSDIIKKMGRASQIIYPQDIGMILIYSGLQPGFKVIEAGCGSGSLTSIMGAHVGADGHVYSYDIRDIAIKQARKNVKQVLKERQNQVSIELKDITTDELGFNQEIDFVMLDMGDPWEAIPRVYRYLKPSGMICCFSPVIEQVKKNHKALILNGFYDIHTFELLQREIQVKLKKFEATRPMSRMVGHTGYLTFARKLETPLEKEMISISESEMSAEEKAEAESEAEEKISDFMGKI